MPKIFRDNVTSYQHLDIMSFCKNSEESSLLYFSCKQIDVLEAKYEKAYDVREAVENDSESASENLSRDFYCLVKVDGIEKIWATRYFMPEED